MKGKQFKFLLGSIAIVLALVYLGYSGFKESVSYYRTIPELRELGDSAYEKRLRVSAPVVSGSIVRESATLVKFMIEEDGQSLPVHYVGTSPIPDTFRDDPSQIVTATVTGTYGRDGVFMATAIQAQCASKYEGEGAVDSEYYLETGG